MKPSVKCYATGHQHSNIIMAAFSQGCGGQIVPSNRLLDGPAAFYGILRGTGELLKQCEWITRDYYYLDHGYFKPGHYEGYYRVTKNGRQADIPDPREKIFPDDRWRKLNLELKPWRKNGKNVVIIPLTGAIGAFYGIQPDKWLDLVTHEVSRHTDRPIIIKQKTEGVITDYLSDCWCLVTHSSNSAADALLAGIPVVTLGESACENVSWGVENIESPWWPERELWAHALAYHQFTLNEMREGTAWRILT